MARPLTLREAIHLQVLAGNPLTAEEIAMFEMFERERWPHERRLAHIRNKALLGIEKDKD